MTFDSKLSLSWSGLRAFEECHNRSRLIRAGKRAKLQDVRGFFHGTVVDRVMREWLEDPDLPAGAMKKLVPEILEREEQAAKDNGDGVVRWKYADDKAEVTAWCIELVTRLEPILHQYVTPYDYEPARRFKTPLTIPGLYGSPVVVWLVGETDLLVRPDKYEVFDLKGTADENYWRKTLGQLVFYDLDIEAEFGEPCSRVGLIQPMCKEMVKTWTVTEQQRREMVQRITAFAHGVWKKDATYAEDREACKFCPTKHACDRFKPRFVTPERRLSIEAMRAAVQSPPVPES